MIEISLGKLVLLALIALIVLGPEKLPGAARTAGALLRRVRNGWDNVRAEVERELEIEQIKRTAREAAARAEAAQSELKDGVQQMRDASGDIATEVAATIRPETAAETGVPVIDQPSVPPADDEPVDPRQSELPLGTPQMLKASTGKPHGHA
jgi:sec-independent protein translocase protein TatB